MIVRRYGHTRKPWAHGLNAALRAVFRRFFPPLVPINKRFSTPSCGVLGTDFVPMVSRRTPQWAQSWAQVYADSVGTGKPIAEQKTRYYAGFQGILRKDSDYAGMPAIFRCKIVGELSKPAALLGYLP